jgi:MFS family permease
MENSYKGQNRLFSPQYVSLFIINMIVSIGFSMVSTTIAVYVKDSGATDAVAGTIAGAMSIAAILIRPFTGILSDRFNRKLLLILSLLGSGIAMAGYGLTQAIPVLLAMRILHGIFFAVVTTVTMTLVAGTIPHDRLSQGMGYFAVGQTISIAVAPSIGLAVGNALGYSATFFAAAGLIAAAIALTKAVYLSAKDIHLQIRNEKISLQSFISKEALIYSLMAIVISGSSGIENSFIVLYGKSLGITNVGWYFTISAFSLLFARIAFGKLSDRHGLVSVLFPGNGIIALAMLLLSFAGTGNPIILFAVASALKALGTGAIQPALQASCLQGVDEKRRGAASSTYYLGADIGQGFAPVLAGVVAGNLGYSSMFALCTFPLLIAAALFGVAISRRKRTNENMCR